MNTQVQPRNLARFSSLHNIVCCPDTKTPLRLVGIKELCCSVADGERERIPEESIGAFISDVRQRAYPLTERVADFLEQDSLSLRVESSGTASRIGPTSEDDELKRSVREWYDRFGWQTNEQGCYHDTASFSQAMPIGHGLYESMSHLSILDRLPGGGFVLDAASGAIAHPEYLAFSWFFKSRVCVDMSVTALRAADGKLRQSDFCCLADICRLPFQDGAFDGAISGYPSRYTGSPATPSHQGTLSGHSTPSPSLYLDRSALFQGTQGAVFPLAVGQEDIKGPLAGSAAPTAPLVGKDAGRLSSS
jgi:uncharacterized protein YbaR (Trm112 family)